VTRAISFLFAAMTIVAGCSGPRPFPSAGNDQTIAPAIVEAARREQAADMAAAARSLSARAKSERANVLVLSSGGQGGAFGAGLIEGWGASGARPEFDLVTGTSTGALIAVFAFLGDEGHAPLRAMYTSHVTSDVFTPYPWVSVLSSSAYAASTPLRSSIAKYITADVVRSIAQEASKGRVLLLSTSNLDLNVMRVWNMTALAADESRPMAERVRRFHDVLIASLSIPGLVPPVFLDGCMHADGGIVRQLFLTDGEYADELGAALTTGRKEGPSVHVIVNRRIGSSPKVIRNQIIPIAARSVQMMLDAALVRDIDEVQRFTALLHGSFHLIALPADSGRRQPEGFLDPAYMKQIHALGARVGANPETWISR
jgi:hypothetical protein